MTKRLPLLVCGVSGVLVLLEFFLAQPLVKRLADEIIAWTLIIVAASFVMGGVNVFLVHLGKVRRRAAGAVYSLVLICCLVGVALLGILGGVGERTFFDWIFQNMQVPMQATMFSVLAFYIASAAYRAFRMRSAQATVLLLAAAVVMLGNVTIGQVMWDRLPDLSRWILGSPSMGAQRGIILGAALGAIATALRILLGVERGYLGLRD